MGGFGSGKGFRYGFRRGQGRVRRYVNELQEIDIRTHRFTPIERLMSSLPIFSRFGFFWVEPIIHCSPSGGIWHTFRCPSCRKGHFKLYAGKDSFGCRSCLNLAYRSENRGKMDRAIDMKWKIIDTVSDEASEYPLRPKGMHSNTYKRLMDRITKYDLLCWEKFFGFRSSDPYALIKEMFSLNS